MSSVCNEKHRYASASAVKPSPSAARIVLTSIVLAIGLLASAATTEEDSDLGKELETLAEEYFEGYFAFRPSWATGTGIHDFDERLEDWSPAAVAQEVDRLHTFEKRLEGIDVTKLGFDARLDHAILSSHIQAELFEWLEMRSHERDPMEYNSRLSWSIEDLLGKNFAPLEIRLQKIIRRESQFGRFLASARKNLKNPPKIYTKKAIELVAGTIKFLRETLPEAVKTVDDEELLVRFRKQNDEAIQEVQAFRKFLEEELLPKSNGVFAIGPERFSKKLLLEEMIDLPLAELKSIGLKALRDTQKRFVATAKEIDPEATPREVFASLKEDHPLADQLVSDTAGSLEEMRQFLIDKKIVTLPSDERCKVVPMPPFMWGFAAMNSPGPLEKVATDAYYYVDTVDDDWSEEKKKEHLRDFNRPVMRIVSIHEAYPGHFIHGLYLRNVPSLTRKLLWSYTYGEGWAHYCEQMMIEEGYGGDNPRLRLAQLSDALVRLCRYHSALGLHTEGMTVEQAVKFFEEEGFQDSYTARREAERGTFDPLYLCYTLGKLKILELRGEYEEKMGEEYSLQKFHDRFLSVGSVPIPMARRVLLGLGGAPVR